MAGLADTTAGDLQGTPIWIGSDEGLPIRFGEIAGITACCPA